MALFPVHLSISRFVCFAFKESLTCNCVGEIIAFFEWSSFPFPFSIANFLHNRLGLCSLAASAFKRLLLSFVCCPSV